MQTSSRFTIAVHTMILVYLIGDRSKLTSDAVAVSTGVNPVVERRIISSLKKRNLVEVFPGKGGTVPVRLAEDVTLWDIFEAVEERDSKEMFSFHDVSKSRCPVSRNLHGVLDEHLRAAREAMKAELDSVTMEAICSRMTEEKGVRIDNLMNILSLL